MCVPATSLSASPQQTHAVFRVGKFLLRQWYKNIKKKKKKKKKKGGRGDVCYNDVGPSGVEGCGWGVGGQGGGGRWGWGGGGNFHRLYRTLTYIVIVVCTRIIDTLIVGP